MTRKRVNASENRQRHEWAFKKFDNGMGFSELSALTSETRGVSRRKARRIVTQTHNDWLESFNDDDIGQKNLQFQCLGRVERTVRKAE